MKKFTMKELIKLILTPTLFLLAFSAVNYGQSNREIIRADSISNYKGEGRYDWTVYIVADKDTLSKISYVQYTLHPTFTPQVRKVTKSIGKYPFSLSEKGMGEFTIGIKVIFKNNRSSSFDYPLKLFSRNKKK